MSLSRDMKVSGMFLGNQLECMGPFKPSGQKVLAANGVAEIAPDQWYDVAALVAMFDDIEKRFGSNTSYQIGKKTFETAPIPPEVNSIPAAMEAVGMGYAFYHRGTSIGYCRFTSTGERSGTMVMHNPYPCDWNRGAVITTAERFKQPGQTVKVVHDDLKPCKKKGGDECTFHISW